MLTDILAEPLRVEQIIGSLAPAEVEDVDSGFGPKMMALLVRFEELGLIESA